MQLFGGRQEPGYGLVECEIPIREMKEVVVHMILESRGKDNIYLRELSGELNEVIPAECAQKETFCKSHSFPLSRSCDVMNNSSRP